jgi:transcriptional regulator with XRE-family HTH domain
LREEIHLTQRELAEKLQISDKAVSKWETARGLPDISLLSDLAEALGVSIAELMMGNIVKSRNRTSNMLKTVFCICPVCGI